MKCNIFSGMPAGSVCLGAVHRRDSYSEGYGTLGNDIDSALVSGYCAELLAWSLTWLILLSFEAGHLNMPPSTREYK